MLNPAATVVIGQAILASLAILKVKIMPVKELLQKKQYFLWASLYGISKMHKWIYIGLGGGGAEKICNNTQNVIQSPS